MKTSELVKALKENDLTETEAYNLLIADMFEFIPLEDVEKSQRLVAYFMYKIQACCFQAITDLRNELKSKG